MGQLNHEPSMEDILASIKRIIAEDSEAVGVKAPRLRRETAIPANEPEPIEPDSLELAPAVEEPEEEEIFPEATAEPVSDPDPVDVLELTMPLANGDASAASSPAPQITPSPAPWTQTPPVAQASETLLSDPARQASRNAFAALSQLQVRTDAAEPNTLEGLVSDLLRPMLREWLDRELPALVERLVAIEIERVSGRG